MLFRQAGNLASEVYTNRYCDRDQAIAPLTIQYPFLQDFRGKQV
ncbi:hypothetical protein [Nostoc spongiaeforme]|nr:hypothetical protein [Nostoc spongiaeforme]